MLAELLLVHTRLQVRGDLREASGDDGAVEIDEGRTDARGCKDLGDAVAHRAGADDDGGGDVVVVRLACRLLTHGDAPDAVLPSTTAQSSASTDRCRVRYAGLKTFTKTSTKKGTSSVSAGLRVCAGGR